ncbi:MAG: hypothetical protein ABR543_09945 [Gemmatimonadaceae bacterium]
MTVGQRASTDPDLRSALSFGLDSTPSDDAIRVAGYIATAFGPSAAALIHYGSHVQRSDARPGSELDFFVIVDDYDEAYESFTAATGPRFTAGTAATLARVLAPNALAVSVPGELALRAKTVVFSIRDFERRCSAKAPDHFVQGRLFQYAQLVWTRDQATRARIVGVIADARARTFDWGRPFLPRRFDVDAYVASLLRTSFSAEIRPEPSERIEMLLEAQKRLLRRIYEPLLIHLADSGVLRRVGEGQYSDLSPPDPRARRRIRAYFVRSKVRATTRWVKFIVLYDDWLGYITQKIERRTGKPIELTERERRYPLIFLWPKAVRFILSRPQK